MQDELKKEGKAVHFVVVNDANAAAHQENFIEMAAFPLFQDSTATTTAWAQHQGGKDDIIIYDKNGKVAQFLPFSGPVSIILSQAEGYANVKNAILKALGL